MLKKNIYIVDCMGAYSLEDLRQELINEIKRDTIENSIDVDIIESNFDLLEKVCNEKWKYNEDFVIEELRAFGVHVSKVNEIIYGLDTLKNFLEFNVNLDKVNFELKNKVENLLEDLKEYFEN